MTVRYKDKPHIEGSASQFNTSSINEVVVCWNGGDMSSEYASDLEVQIGNVWKPLTDAFRDSDVITDNHNTRFFEPRSPEDRERGYAL